MTQQFDSSLIPTEEQHDEHFPSRIICDNCQEKFSQVDDEDICPLCQDEQEKERQAASDAKLNRCIELVDALAERYADEARIQTPLTRYAAKVGALTAFISSWAHRSPEILRDLERQGNNKAEAPNESTL